jgi:hypothetical protein
MTLPREEYPDQITNEIAFEIGKGDFLSFYDSPTWRPNCEYFKYVRFFDWGNPNQYGTPNSDKELEWNWHFIGSLKENLFNLEQKRHYIRGVFASYAGKIVENHLSFCFANSFPTRDRIAKWSDEVLKNKFGGERVWLIEKSQNMLTCPAIASLKIKGDDEIITYLTDG